MALLTHHIGVAIKDFLEGQEIEGEPASRNEPFSDEKYTIETVHLADPNNPILVTSGGIFKIVILAANTAPRIEPRPMKDITPPRGGQTRYEDDDETY